MESAHMTTHPLLSRSPSPSHLSSIVSFLYQPFPLSVSASHPLPSLTSPFFVLSVVLHINYTPSFYPCCLLLLSLLCLLHPIFPLFPAALSYLTPSLFHLSQLEVCSQSVIWGRLSLTPGRSFILPPSQSTRT